MSTKYQFIEQRVLEYDLKSRDVGERFRFWHVEPLLNQASDLLDRCLKERALARQLAVLEFESDIDLQDRNELEEIEDKRRIAGLYERDRAISQTRHSAFAYITDYFHRVHKGLPATTENKDWDRARKDIKVAETDSEPESKILEWAKADMPYVERYWFFRQGLLEARRLARQSRGPLDYKFQIEEAASRIQRDFLDAYDRITAASEGLQSIYLRGDEARPPPPTLDGMAQIDECVAWVRDTVQRLAAFSQLDQIFTVLVSARRSLVSGQSWPMSAAASELNAEVALSLRSTMFAGHRFVRFRGVAAHSMGIEDRYATCDLRMPLTTLVSNADGYLVPGPEQSRLPWCALGRVENWGSARSPDVAGAVSLLNSSPVGTNDSNGQFSLKINVPEAFSKKPFLLEDIILEFTFAGQPVV